MAAHDDASIERSQSENSSISEKNERAPILHHNQPSERKTCCSYLRKCLFISSFILLFLIFIFNIVIVSRSTNCPACTCGVGTASTDNQIANQTAILSDLIHQEMRATFKNLSDFTAVHLRNVTQSLEQVSVNSKAILTNLSASLQQVLETTISAMHKNISDSVQQVLETTGNSTTMLTTHLSSFMQQVVDTTGDTSQTVSNIVDTLANHDSTSVSTAGTINDLLLITQKLLQLQNVSSSLNSISVSCKDIKATLPNSPTGYYHVNSHTIYCNMDTLCNGTGGWTRLAYLDMSENCICPPGFRLYQSEGVRACGRASSSGGSCTSVKFPSNGISYSQVCGKVVGYQYKTPDAVQTRQNASIESYYVDGVSITHGSPRQHVWTLMAGYMDRIDKGSCGRESICPCTDSCLSSRVNSFIGSYYFCESGTSSKHNHEFCTSDPLWDGQGCHHDEGPCCSVPGLPWFHRDYGTTTTTDYLELRVCGEEGTSNEDVPVGYYEIYVK